MKKEAYENVFRDYRNMVFYAFQVYVGVTFILAILSFGCGIMKFLGDPETAFEITETFLCFPAGMVLMRQALAMLQTQGCIVHLEDQVMNRPQVVTLGYVEGQSKALAAERLAIVSGGLWKGGN